MIRLECTHTGEVADIQLYGDTIRCGVHSGQQYDTATEFLQMAQRCEALDLDWVSGFDHFRPPDAGPSGPCMEGTTLMAAVAARTQRIRCATLVLGVAYRHPAVVASIAATIDQISAGRLELGVGATWHDDAHGQYGIALPPLRARMGMLDEACRIMRSLWTRESTTFEGRHFNLRDARLEPKPVQEHLPLVIGGAGERRMLRIVAEHADVWNTVAGGLDDYRRKLGVLAGHCVDAGRHPSAIRKSLLYRAVLGVDEREARERLDELVPRESPMRGSIWSGTPEQCVEHLQQFVALGVGDVLLNVRPPLDWHTIELVASRVAPALKGAGAGASS